MNLNLDLIIGVNLNDAELHVGYNSAVDDEMNAHIWRET